MAPAPQYDMGSAANGLSRSVSPHTAPAAQEPIRVAFEMVPDATQPGRDRLPMRVNIFPHNNTESIVATVKAYYGLGHPDCTKGISFQDEHGSIIIPQYEIFRDNMSIYVRIFDVPNYRNASRSPAANNDDHYAAGSSALHQDGPHASRPASRTSRIRSPSPNSSRGRRSTNTGTASKKGRSRSARNRDAQPDMAGYLSEDSVHGSASGRSKEILGSTEISLDNIVEGGRRKRPRFESSELPLFAPPQMPAAPSNSSASPIRRSDHHRNSLPFVHPGQNPFSNCRPPLQSPQSYTHGYAPSGMYATPGVESRRNRGYSGSAAGPGLGMMPTPDPTVGSTVSEEDKDVAMQLMRLGNGMSEMSHGRTSASTVDDTFSRHADHASSAGATSDEDMESEDEAPAARRQRLDAAGNHKRVYHTTESHFVVPQDNAEVSDDDIIKDEAVAGGFMAAPDWKSPKPKSSMPGIARPRAQSTGKARSTKSSKSKAKKVATAPGPMSPASMPASRKQSVTSTTAYPLAAGEDEQPDLSTKPRCQRCRKSKKGCDRQRPCGRCKDAGIPPEQCISEDETNGRKGRYGRHMGVPLNKEEIAMQQNMLLPAAPISTATDVQDSMIGSMDNNKKRKK